MIALALYFSACTAVTATVAHNMLPGLKPSKGAWRGATHDGSFDGYDPSSFVGEFGVPLHIYRTFKTPHVTGLTQQETAWVQSGGILFYSIQPQNWSEAATSMADREIAAHAVAVKSVAPAQVMVVVGYEPDGHAAESQPNIDQVYGTVAEYRAMREYWKRAFDSAGVTNALWVMDYSCNIRTHFWVAKELWPGDDQISWLFFNLFQKKKMLKDGGNCSDMLDSIYAQFASGSGEGHEWSQLPWGLGAFGTMHEEMGPAKKLIPMQDRKECLQGVELAFESATYPHLKASIYFDSLNSQISSRNETLSPELVPTFEQYLKAPPFVANDDETLIVV